MRFALLIALLSQLSVFGQTEQQGDVQIFQDKLLDRIISHHIIQNEESASIKGYRIQLISTADRKYALEMKSNCLQRFPEIKAHLVYQQPYFKFRVGDFLSKLEAYKELQDIKIFFEDAYIVRDDIDVTAL